jgi:hypothetical protein
VHSYNPGMEKAEAGRALVLGQLQLYDEILSRERLA